MIVNRALALAGWLAERTLMNTKNKTDKTAGASQNCDHNEMKLSYVEGKVWECAKCGYLYDNEQPQAQHSPLPWRLRYRKGLAIIDGEYFDIAQMERSGSAATEYEANARLIVASVNHAEALAEALRRLTGPRWATKDDIQKANQVLHDYETAGKGRVNE